MPRQDTAPRWLLAAVIAIHGAAVLALARPGPAPIEAPRPLAVALLTPSAAPEPASAPQPPRPQRMPAAKPRPAPRVAPTASLPKPVATPQAPVPEPAAPVAAAAASDPSPPRGAASPAPIQPARFDAAYLRNPPPPYPPLARRLGEQGKVQLRVFVDATGQAAAVELKASSGSPRLDASALETVRAWRFVPARQGNEPVGAWVVVPINFHLEG